MDIRARLKTGRLYFDGGMGTLLQARGLSAGELPEVWNITRPEIITDIHRQYLLAGCNILKANTFGANSLKFSGLNAQHSLEEIISSALANARLALSRVDSPEDKFVALDIGPLGRLLKPLGDLEFEAAVKIFAETVNLGVKHGADLILIETMNDSYETKAAVLAAKENSDLPIFVTNAYDESGKLVTGASPAAMVALLEGLRVDALGINCSLGPDKMLPVVSELIKYSSLPIIVNPNAGLPVIKNGKTAFEVTADEFSDSMVKIAEMGASLLGGCCGTTPEHILLTKAKTESIPLPPPCKKSETLVSSYTHCVEIGGKPVLIGERINPTGKPTFKAALRNNDFEYILREGTAQQDLGADILDVNVGLPEIDETAVLLRAVRELQAVTDLPLQIDTSDPASMEAALREYNGKALINSVNGKAEVMEAVFPLAAKYGGVVIALTLDESGIPSDSRGRIAIAQKIIAEAAEYGIDKKDIIVDPLAMTISSDTSSALVTLECIRELKKLGIKTSLGVSNVSFGLPQRSNINATFFAMALNNGLNAAIMNPHSDEMLRTYYAFCALSNSDLQCAKYIEYSTKQQADAPTEVKKEAEASPQSTLHRAIVRGLKDGAAAASENCLASMQPLEVINQCIIPALDEIGVAFEQKKAFLPQLLMSAESAKAAFEVIKNKFEVSGGNRIKKYKIVIATVKGDIHDIGKNIVKILLENYDYDVIDLGKDVPPEEIVKTAISENAPLVGLSALMTTTVPSMAETIKLLRENAPACRVMVGGAVLTQEYADMIGADKYAKDAMEAVRYAELLLQRGKNP